MCNCKKECKHKNLVWCDEHKKVTCRDCGMEFTEKSDWTYTPYYPYIPYPTYPPIVTYGATTTSGTCDITSVKN